MHFNLKIKPGEIFYSDMAKTILERNWRHHHILRVELFWEFGGRVGSHCMIGRLGVRVQSRWQLSFVLIGFIFSGVVQMIG